MARCASTCTAMLSCFSLTAISRHTLIFLVAVW
jgi:hypothetical protein